MSEASAIVEKLRKRAAYLRKCSLPPATLICMADELERLAKEIERDVVTCMANEPMVKTDAAPGGDV
jgi:hypothetical protein